MPLSGLKRVCRDGTGGDPRLPVACSGAEGDSGVSQDRTLPEWEKSFCEPVKREDRGSPVVLGAPSLDQGPRDTG